MPARLYYRGEGDGRKVVIEQDGRTIAVYNSPAELVESHIKGILAKDRMHADRVREIMRQYRPEPDNPPDTKG